MGLKQLFSLACICFIGLSTSAQDSIPEIIYEEKTEFIESFPNRITSRLFYVNTSNSFIINDRNSNLYFELSPNKQGRMGATVSFRSVSISYSFAPDFLSENKNNADSKLLNLSLRTYFGQWMQALELYQEKGFTIENQEAGIYFPNTKTFKIGGATSYIFNENFSHQAISTQNQKQIKNAGSFIPRLIYYYTKFDIITPTEDDSTIHLFDLAFAPAYFYNFVPAKNLLLSAGVSAGIGLNYSKSDTENLTSLLTELNFKSSLTYDISNLYLGARYSYLILNHNTDRSSYVEDSILFTEIFVGYRFRAPKKLVKKADEINKKLMPKNKYVSN